MNYRQILTLYIKYIHSKEDQKTDKKPFVLDKKKNLRKHIRGSNFSYFFMPINYKFIQSK